MASDVVQHALTIALAHVSPPDSPHTQRAWLRGIVRNVIRRQFRSLRRTRAAMEGVASTRDRAVLPDPPHEQTDARDRRRGIVHALFLAVADLDTADQDLFYAFYRSDRSHASIAAELGTTVKAVEARLYRLRARLRAMEPFPVSPS